MAHCHLGMGVLPAPRLLSELPFVFVTAPPPLKTQHQLIAQLKSHSSGGRARWDFPARWSCCWLMAFLIDFCAHTLVPRKHESLTSRRARRCDDLMDQFWQRDELERLFAYWRVWIKHLFSARWELVLEDKKRLVLNAPFACLFSLGPGVCIPFWEPTGIWRGLHNACWPALN